MITYWIEGIKDGDYIIKGPFDTIKEAHSFKDFYDHWVVSKVEEEKIDYLAWDKERP